MYWTPKLGISQAFSQQSRKVDDWINQDKFMAITRQPLKFQQLNTMKIYILLTSQGLGHLG